MAHLRKPGGRDLTGYDAARNLQILPLGKSTSFYLVSGDGLEVFTDDPACASVNAGAGDSRDAHRDRTLTAWEKSQVIRVVRLTARAPGTTRLRATLDRRDWITPLTVRVTQDPDARQVGRDVAQVTPELRAELEGLPLREAVMRVAEDQMNSRIARETRGFGAYMDAQYDWCGGFAYWCWKQASAILAVENPFGPRSTVLWSPQRALHWGIQETTPGQILRWAGSSPMDGRGRQEFRDLGYNGLTLQRGDICLVRRGSAGGWKHVCMVHSFDGNNLVTIDGNQGLPSIKTVKRDFLATVPGGGHALVFVAVLGV